ncbi:hybrid sensor histidine kinase/response regulator [Thiothrix nivea]|uniref:Sensory/regulatory protein RpfC n=1 Tax=Thiothrix nivea (strain ATCC 35100 / DSM 5205 / JP2) TaxID=870187 RepID=A0A656HJ28_THINJ|nr:response regulator [Thiothrix nivea]EIJ36054.1 integral membrane sensor hybrid histidine kinase [Thiothrix nivea DSM 5205]
MRIFTNLRWLQLIDAALLSIMLGVIAMLLWFSLSDVSSKARQHQQEATAALQDAKASFLQQIELETRIDAQREAYDLLDEAFFKFANNPNSDREQLPHLHELSTELLAEYQNLTAVWPANAGEALREQLEELTGIMAGLADELDTLSPGHWQQLARDAHDTARDARELMETLESLDDAAAQQVVSTIQHSIDATSNSTAQMATRLETIKQRASWVTALLIAGLLVSRFYFSGNFKQLILKAQHAQAVAEDAVKTKARFLATMSHEIRTPMNGVIGMTRLLMNTPMNKKQLEFVESIHLSGEHLLTVINDVLDFSKIEAGKLDLKHEPLELRACIEDVLNLLTSKALEKNLELAYAVGPTIPLFIEGDVVRLRQILTNLIGNAIKFTDSGEITVFVMPRSHHGDEYELEFQINDTGSGIPEERLESIFEQFSQADNALTRRGEGTGLGLAISRRLVEMMDGRIWAESTLGVGSRFHFTIRARKGEGKLKPFLHPDIPEIVGKRILIVENNPANHQALRDFCTGWGATVRAYCTSSEAIAAIASGHAFDIGLVDSNLPNASALDFGKYVRTRYSKHEFPLILIAPPNDAHPKESVREIFNLYLSKPITRSRLFDSLMTVMGELNLVTARPEQSRLKLGERLPLAILLAEDNPINQIVAASILDEMAYKAEIAENGLQALEALRKKPFDVIFMDMQMPEMDGLEATRRIRAEFPPARQPVIIAMTANAMEGDRQQCLNAGMNDYISKPILPEAIETALQRSLPSLPRQPERV